MKKGLLILCLFMGLLFLTGCDIGYTAADYNNRGIYKAQAGDYKGAIEDFSKAFELDPTNKKYSENMFKALELSRQNTYNEVLDIMGDL